MTPRYKSRSGSADKADTTIREARASAVELVALALVAAAVIATEILLTRIFSFITWHHYTPLVIGIALLGFGCAGAWLSVRLRPSDTAADSGAFRAALGREALAFAVLLPSSLALVSRVPFNPSRIFAGPGALAWLAVEIVLVLLPFIAAGLFICRVLSRYRASAGLVYGVDLGASALGVLMGLALLRVTSAETAIVIVALFAATAAALVASERAVRVAAEVVAAGLALAAIAMGTTPFGVFRPPPSKEMAVFASDPGRRAFLAWSRWNPIARIDVTDELTGPVPDFGGELAPPARPLAGRERYRFLFQDGTAPSAFLRIEPPVENVPYLTRYLQSGPYAVRRNARTLVIGLGGGIDLAIALAAGARSVTGVEVNPVTLSLLTREHAAYTGNVAHDPRVRLVQAEGRAFVRADRSEPYDVIQLSGADTFAALVSGSGSLTEGYLYTTEALGDFLSRLTPGGIVSFSRPFFTPPRETLKLVATAAEALRARGVAEPGAHIMVLGGRFWADTLISPSPLAPDDIAALERFASANGFAVLATPSADLPTPWDRYLSLDAEAARRFRADYVFDVDPATDDRPFFYDYARWGRIIENRNLRVNRGYEGYYTAESPIGPLPVGNVMLAAAVLIIGALAVVLIVLPLLDRRAALARDPAFAFRVLGACAALGLGFIAVEIVLIQSFQLSLGSPALALAVVLFSMLGAAGLGSLVAQRFETTTFRRVMPAIAVVVAALAFLLPQVTGRLAGAGPAVRVVVAAVLTAAPGFLMGMPFPLLIRLIGARHTTLVPWAWAANGSLSVLGSVLATFVAMFVGFRAVMLAAAVVYLLGFIAMLPATAAMSETRPLSGREGTSSASGPASA